MSQDERPAKLEREEPEAAVVEEGSETPQAEPEPAMETGAPTKKEVTAATRSVLKGKLARLAPIMSLPDGRAAVVWRHTAGEYINEATVELVVLKRGADGWTVEGVKQVVDGSTPWLDEDEPPPLAVTARAQDYDDDGETEILVRVRYALMCPGGGPNTVTSLDIYDITPSLQVAMSTELHHLMDAYPEAETRASVKHEDLDGDGHRDVKVEYVSKPDGKTVRATNKWIYAPSDDAWALTKPEYERWGCDW